MADTEVWKTITENSKYEVSSLGNVRNKKTGRILKPASKCGYLSVGLSSKIGKTHSIHRLVALEFIDNPENKPHVNHKDKNRSNNCIDNLEWCTALENNIHKSSTLEQTTNQNLKIWRLNKKTNEKLQLYNSIHDAANWCIEHNFAANMNSVRGTISCAIRGVYKSASGFNWIVDEQSSMDNEIWKNIFINGQTFQNYHISTLGRFKNSKGVIMENYKPHHSGYIYVRVNKNKYALHRLVASTYLENPENKPFVNHIDGNKTNNALSNLEWVTCKENNQHNHNVGLIKCFTRKVGKFNLDDTLIKEYNSIVEATKDTNCKTIKHVLYKRQNTAGGFIWKYLD
jgi:hypothetical protein